MLVKVLNQEHPEYDGPRLGQYAALYEGGKSWEALVNTWLPRYPQESNENYAHRIERALYHNHAGPILDVIAAGLFSQSPTYEDYEHDWFETFSDNCDRDGTSIDLWFKRWLIDALRDKRALCWVNLPPRDPDREYTSLGEEEGSGALDAYLVPIGAEKVIDWDRDEAGIKWLIFRDIVSERVALDAKRQQRIRWTYIDREVVRRFEWWEKEGQSAPTEESDAAELPPVFHNFGEIPIVELCLPDGLHAMGKLHHPAIAHLRARNDLSWAMYRANHPLLVIKTKWLDGDPVLGAGRYLPIEKDGDVAYIGPDPGAFQISAEDVKALREEMYRVVHQMSIGMDSDASSSRMSGESKNADWRAMEIVLSSLAEIVKPAMVRVLRLVALARGAKESEPTIGGLEGWQEEDLTVWLAAAAAALDAAQLSPTFRKEVAKRQAVRLLSDANAETVKTITDEIDSASVDDPSPYVAPHMPPPPPDDPKGAPKANDPKANDPKAGGRLR